MDRQKTIELERLINEKLSKFTTSTAQVKDATLGHFEITIKFRNDHELDAAIAQLNKTH